jgi:hypothetical protein
MLTQPAPTVTPRECGGKWVFEFAETVLEVDPAVGGRITSFRLGGDEVLTGPEVNEVNWGSTLWPSPQSAWGWPPAAEVDTEPYRVSLQGNVLVLEGPTIRSGAIAGLGIVKRLAANAAQGLVCLEYEIVNRGTEPREVAAWEVTRVPRDNLQFFAEGAPGDVKKVCDLLPLESAGGVAWLQYDPARMVGNLSTGRDSGEGWVASLRGDLLFAKFFPKAPAGRAAPGEAEVFLYLSGENPYVEVEAQSELHHLAPGDSFRWPVVWAARRVPAGIGRSELVETVRGVLR